MSAALDEEAGRIRAKLAGETRDALERLDAFDEIDSTNTFLMNASPPAAGRAGVAIAAAQTAGRGRGGRFWLSPADEGVWLSLAYTFREMPAQPAAVTLALGAAAARILHEFGATTVGLKWPNDLVADDRKLGGLLVESRSATAGACTLVCGIGINLTVSEKTANGVVEERPPVGLDELVKNPPERATLAAALIDAFFDALAHYDEEGLEPFVFHWNALDRLDGREVKVRQGNETLYGTARGIDEDGALQLETRHGIRRIVSGTVRLARNG